MAPTSRHYRRTACARWSVSYEARHRPLRDSWRRLRTVRRRVADQVEDGSRIRPGHTDGLQTRPTKDVCQGKGKGGKEKGTGHISASLKWICTLSPFPRLPCLALQTIPIGIC